MELAKKFAIDFLKYQAAEIMVLLTNEHRKMVSICLDWIEVANHFR